MDYGSQNTDNLVCHRG